MAVGEAEAARVTGPLTDNGIAANAAVATYAADTDRRRRAGVAWAAQ